MNTSISSSFLLGFNISWWTECYCTNFVWIQYPFWLPDQTVVWQKGSPEQWMKYRIFLEKEHVCRTPFLNYACWTWHHITSCQLPRFLELTSSRVVSPNYPLETSRKNHDKSRLLGYVSGGMFFLIVSKENPGLHYIRLTMHETNLENTKCQITWV